LGVADTPDLAPLLDWNDPSGTEARLRPLAERLGAGIESGYRAEVFSQLARALGLQDRFYEAHTWIDRAEADGADLPPRARVRVLLERGRLHNSAGHPDRGRPQFERAWELAGTAGQDGLAVDAAHMLAIVASGDEALAWNLRALELAQASPDPEARRWRASLFNNLGWTYHDRGEYARALDLFQQAVPLRQEMGQLREHHIARWCVARALRSLERLEESLAIQRELEGQAHGRGEPQDGFVLEELAECLHALRREAEARPYFAAAHRALSAEAWLAQHEPERIGRLKRLGEGR
jgi:tetratricopeptide (TPR) repeat protein